MSVYQKIATLFQSSKTTVSFTAEEQALRWQLLQSDPGNFEYEEDGFTYTFKEGAEKIQWTEIDRVVAYKADRLTVDVICLKILWRGMEWMITEDTPGWSQFLKRLAIAFPSILDNWDDQIAQPPFATSYMVLYERPDHVLPDFSNFYASFYDIPPLLIISFFEGQGWSIRKAGWTQWEMTNAWAELHLEPDNQGVLLNGRVVFHPANITVLDQLLNKVGSYQYEFYDAEKKLLLERRNP